MEENTNAKRNRFILIALIAIILMSALVYAYLRYSAVNQTKGQELASIGNKNELPVRVSPRSIGAPIDSDIPIDGGNTNASKDIYNFDFNIHEKIVASQQNELDTLIKSLIANKNIINKIYIRGFTDYIGSDRYNQILSEKRCHYIASRFTGTGVLIEEKGYGKKVPIANNDNEEGRAKNRRVEITILSKKVTK